MRPRCHAGPRGAPALRKGGNANLLHDLARPGELQLWVVCAISEGIAGACRAKVDADGDAAGCQVADGLRWQLGAQAWTHALRVAPRATSRQPYRCRPHAGRPLQNPTRVSACERAMAAPARATKRSRSRARRHGFLYTEPAAHRADFGDARELIHAGLSLACAALNAPHFQDPVPRGWITR